MKFELDDCVMHNWESNTALTSKLAYGNTSTMSALHEQQQQPLWFNPSHNGQIAVKAEPIDYAIQMQANRTPPQTTMPSIPSPVLSTQSAMDQLLEQIPSSFRQLGVFNPLTPPGYSGLMFPSLLKNQWTPSKLQNLIKIDNNNLNDDTNENSSMVTSSLTPPMDVTPPKSPKDLSMNEQTPEKEDQTLNGIDGQSESLDSYDEDSDDYGDDDKSKGSSKRKSSNGKPKQYKCKQCKQISVSKQEFWDHTRSHIKPEKMLQCPKCPFVTEYKHHLEYHLRNHSRSKPFQCPKCSYSCVNKSMLNSHLKSHSSVFQYRCADCNYATKYCHSLKLHLRKYTHKPDIVLNLDGTPNPLPIIDVYGTRRGPKSKTTTSKLLEEIERCDKNNPCSTNSNPPKAQLSPPLTPSTSTGLSVTNNNSTPTSLLMANMLQNVGNGMPLFPYLNLNFQMFAAHQQKQQQQQKALEQENSFHNSCDRIDDNVSNEMDSFINENDVGDENQTDSDDIKMEKERVSTPSIGNKNSRRKGRAFKLDEKQLSEVDEIDDENSLSNQNQPPQSPVSSNNNNNKISTTSSTAHMFECKFCGIIFKDNILYTIHMGYHGYNDVWTCNMCGEKTDNAVQFFLHIAKFPHS